MVRQMEHHSDHLKLLDIDILELKVLLLYQDIVGIVGMEDLVIVHILE